MKRLIFLLAIIVGMPSIAADQRIENMAANCNDVMDRGVCRVALDPKDYPNETIPIVLPNGVRRINKNVYLAIRATGFQKDAQGRWMMCQKVYEACSEWDSDACIAVRSLWRQ